MPLMNITGNLTAAAIMFTVAGTLVGGMEKTLPREAKQKAARITARANSTGLDTVIPRARPMMIATREIAVPKAKEASTSPMIMVSTLTGQDISRSSVLACASHGTTTGDIEVAVKKRIIPRNPGIIKSRVIFLPMLKERNRKTGKRRPKIITGPLE
jgi:hypothetical protein